MPRKSNPLQTRVFFFSPRSLSGALRRTTQYWAKLPKAKVLRSKVKKRYWGARQRIDIQLSKLQYSKRLFMFLHQGWHLNKEKETAFSTACLANFGSTGTSLFEIWTSAWRNIFTFLDRMLLFLSSLGLLSFLPRTSFRFWFFHEQRFFHKQRASTCEFCKVRDVNKLCAPTWAVAVKIPPRDSPRSEIMTPSWFTNFYMKIRFF